MGLNSYGKKVERHSLSHARKTTSPFKNCIDQFWRPELYTIAHRAALQGAAARLPFTTGGG
jgi:hypothetical protein